MSCPYDYDDLEGDPFTGEPGPEDVSMYVERLMVEWDKSLNRRAVRELIERHREEFDELSGRAAQERINELERRVADSLRQIEALRAANPDGVAVPALTQTANNLVKQNDEQLKKIRQLERQIERLRKDNKDLRQMLADA